MITATLHAVRKSFARPDLSKDFKNCRVDILDLGDRPVARWTFSPGWVFSKDMKPFMGKSARECTHVGYVLRGRFDLRTDDGTRYTLGPGDCVRVSGDHEARVVGDEPVEILDFGDIGEIVKAIRSERGPGSGLTREWYPDDD